MIETRAQKGNGHTETYRGKYAYMHYRTINAQQTSYSRHVLHEQVLQHPTLLQDLVAGAGKSIFLVRWFFDIFILKLDMVPLGALDSHACRKTYDPI